MIKNVLTASFILFVFGSIASYGASSNIEQSKAVGDSLKTTKEQVKQSAREVGTEAKKVGRSVAKSAKTVGKAVSKEAREFGHAVSDGAKKVKKDVKESFGSNK